MLVGDSNVGKSCLITKYLNNTFSEEYEPTKLSTIIKKLTLEVEWHDD